MRLYLDTADRTGAEDWLATGLFEGLTTNPTILRRSSLGVQDIPEIYRWAVHAGAKEVFFQAWGEDTATLVERGSRLRDLGPEVVVKLVASRAGAHACAALSADGIPTLITAVYAPGQAVIAAAAGATYIAPYLGKMRDAGRSAIADVVTMQEVLSATDSRTKILLASVRNVDEIVQAAQHGVDCFTFGLTVADEFFSDELTAEAVRLFERAVLDGSAP